MVFLLITVILLSVSLTAAQDSNIRNFQVASRNRTHITFSWDIVDGYYTSSYISYFRVYYQHRSSTQSIYIPYNSVTRNGATFSYTTSLAMLNNGPYTMWLLVYRSSRIQPRTTHSKKTFMKFNEAGTVLELKVHLGQPTKTCSDFLGSNSNGMSQQMSREVDWLLYESCQCTLPYDLSVQDGYFTCTASNFVVFRGKLSTHDKSVDFPSLTAGLTNILTGPDMYQETQITIYGVGYLVSPGPCGLTIPRLDFPHCFNDTHGSVNKTSVPSAQAAVSTPAPQDYTAVTTIVAVMCTTILILVFIGCVVFLVMGLWRMKHKQVTKVSRDLELASESRSRNISLPNEHEHLYSNPDVPIQRNPVYGKVH